MSRKAQQQENIFEPVVEFVQDAKKLLQMAKRPDLSGKFFSLILNFPLFDKTNVFAQNF